MKINTEWKDYEIIATGDGEKLERWKNVTLLRPDPQVIWHAKTPLVRVKKPDARYIRSSTGGGRWEFEKKLPDSWNVSWRDLTFVVRPMNFKHTGLFPEQAANWDKMRALIGKAKAENPEKPIKVLNLFAYTGGATVACARSGADVVHVDAAKGMVERAGENARLSGVNSGIRYIIDDCAKFVKREIRRGNKYDAIIMDPPSYGRGPNGEMWKIEDNLYDFVTLCTQVLADDPLFVLINSYTTGLQPTVIKNILTLTLSGRSGSAEAYEVGLPTDEGIVLPCGCSGMFIGE